MIRPRLNLHFLPLLPFLTMLFQPALRAAASPSEHATLSGAQVHVYNLIGSVELGAGSGTSVQVVLTPGGKDAALGSKTFESNGTFFVVTYPSDHIRSSQMRWGSSTSMQIAKDGTFGDRPSVAHGSITETPRGVEAERRARSHTDFVMRDRTEDDGTGRCTETIDDHRFAR